MDPLAFYLQVGFKHIADLAAYDHLLFLIALCAVYRLEQWRSIAILVTAFTIGHSITLALAALDTVRISSSLIEFLIPTTILITALLNVVRAPSESVRANMGPNYALALFFGLIHGMGFSNYFRALLMDESSILVPLVGFNLGIELGQLMIVAVIIALAYVFLNVLSVKHRDWNVFVSGGAAALALQLMLANQFW
ncbi:MAG: HupE/UreJ family protein [Pseudomonadota bacterium]